MILEYITAALGHAQCEPLDDAEPRHSEAPDRPGILCNRERARSVQEKPCRRHRQTPDRRLRRGLPVPPAAPWERSPGRIPVPEHEIRPAS